MNNKAFTLIEILAAVVIMGLISGTAVVGVNSSITKSHNNYCTSTVDMMTVAGRNYFNDNKTKMPLEIGSRQCVTLKTLQLEKYIDPLKDYQNSSCNVDNSQLCAMKITNNSYYYISKLDCNKCTTENVNEVDSTPEISFTPDGGENSNNKDIIVTMNITDSKNEIASYSYTVYQKTSKGNIAVSTVDYTKYNKDKKITIKINKNGTYYIEGYAYNTVGKRGTKTSSDYNLKYTLNCNNQVKISAKKNGNTNIAEEQWINGTLNMYVEVKGAINSYNVYTSKNSAAFVKENNAFLSGKEKTTVSKKDTGKYKIKVVAYDEQGNSCEVTTKDYYLDNTAPTCTTKFKDSSQSGKWVNNDVVLAVDKCIDADSGCNENSKTITNTIKVEINKAVSVGAVRDNAGNSGTCSVSPANVRIDKTSPKCTTTGGNGTWTNGTRTIIGTCSDMGGSACTKNISQVYNSNINTTTAGPAGNGVGGRVYDNAGNSASCPANQTVRIDRTAPSCSSSGGSVSWTNISRTLSGICNDGGGSGCANNANWLINWEGSWTGLSPGVVSDNAGNTTTCPANQTVRIDKSKPVMSYWLENDSTGLRHTPGTWSRNGLYRHLEYTDTGGSYVNRVQFSTDNGASWHNETNVAKWWIGETNSVQLFRAIDNAGNISDIISVPLMIDGTPPTYTGVAVHCGDIFGIHGTAYVQLDFTDSLSGLGYRRAVSYDSSHLGGVVFVGNFGGVQSSGDILATGGPWQGFEHTICDVAGNCNSWNDSYVPNGC